MRVREGSVQATRWLVATFLGLGIFLRIYNFWTPGLWTDEYGTWWVLASGEWGDAAHRAISRGTQSPFYYFVVKLFTDPLGFGPVSLRLPSVLFGIGTLTLAYPLANQVFQDRHAALLALAAFAVNQRLIWYSQEARPYALALVLVMLSFLFFLSMLKREKLSTCIGYVLATAGVYYAHYMFAFIVVIQLLHLFATRGWLWLTSRAWQLSFLALFLLSIPGMYQVVSLTGRREVLNWMPPQDWLAPLAVAGKFLNPWIFSFTALAVLAIGLKEMGNGKTAVRRNLLLSWFLLPIAAFAVIPPLFGIQLLHARYVLFVAPAVLCIAAWLMASANRGTWLKWVPLAVFVVLTLALDVLPSLRTHGAFRPDQGWRNSAQLLAGSVHPDDVVLLHTGFVEADQFTHAEADSEARLAVRWPLVANLPPAHGYKILDLPFRVSRGTGPYLTAVLREAVKHPRIWIIGAGETVRHVRGALIGRSRFKVRKDLRLGGLSVVVLEREGERPRQRSE